MAAMGWHMQSCCRGRMQAVQLAGGSGPADSRVCSHACLARLAYSWSSPTRAAMVGHIT